MSERKNNTSHFFYFLPYFVFAIVICFSCVLLSFSNKQKTSKFTINIVHTVGKTPLVLDSQQYRNELGQHFTVTKLKYYLSNFVLKQKNGKELKVNDSFLINEEEPESKQIAFNVPSNEEYTSLEFIIGVDSLHNCSGAQSGALDPIHAMFWTWNSGYIFLKLEGASPASNAPGHVFEYHIGGYRQPNDCIRKVNLPFTKKITEDDTRIYLKTDLLEVLKNPTIINFAQLSSVTDSKNAGTMADNYKDMFSIEQ